VTDCADTQIIRNQAEGLIPDLLKYAEENDERYQLDATIEIYYHKYLYMFWASICPSSGVQVVCYCIWCSAW